MRVRNELDDPFMMGPTSILDKYTPTIYLTGEVNSKMMEKFREALRELEYARRATTALLVIDSPGGSVVEGFQILNIMRGSRIQFMTYCASKAYSMGAVLLAAGEKGKRFMAPLSDAMIHSVQAGAFGHIEELRISMDRIERLNREVLRELATSCGTTVAELEKKIKATGSTDLYLDPWGAKAIGLIDEVAQVALHQAMVFQLEVNPVPDPKKPKKVRKPKAEVKVEPKAKSPKRVTTKE